MPRERLGSFTQRYIGTVQHFGWLERIMQVTLLLNLLDAIFTLWWLQTAQATEANPLMAAAIATHPIVFVLVKCTLVGLGSWLLWRHRRRPLAVISIFVAFLTYYGLLLVHLGAADVRLLRAFGL